MTTETLPEALNVTLPVTTALRQQITAGTNVVDLAHAFEVDSHEMAQLATAEMQRFRAQGKALKEVMDGFLAPAQQIMERGRAFFNPAIKAYAEGETILKGKLVTWNEQERARIARENAERERIAREARQKAEQEAAAARAKADQEAEAKRREAAEAARRQAEAIAAGRAAEAAAAAAQAAELAQQASAIEETAAVEATTALVSAAAVVESAAPVRQTKIAGFSTREKWEAEMTVATEAEAIRAIAAAIGQRPELVAYLKLDTSALNKAASAQKAVFNVPGFKATKNTLAVAR